MATIQRKDLRKLDPKLRMMARGSEKVSTFRAERSAAVVVRRPGLLKMPLLREPDAVSTERAELPKKEKRGRLKETSSAVFANVFLELTESGEPKSFRSLEKVQRQQNLLTASVPLSELAKLAADPAVASVQLGEQIVFRPPLNITTDTGPPGAAARHVGGTVRHRGGEGVLIGIIDVLGFDFAHSDFLEASGDTRFLRIWDQGGSVHGPPDGFDYGSEIVQEQMNAALAAAPGLGVPATDLEPQSQMQQSSHGTHVASIAAGNHGLCPKAAIAAVLISLADEDSDRRKSFYDSTRIAHAVDYLFCLGDELGMPVSINISLGTNGHAHDASSAGSRWIESALSVPGRSVCVAAGNAGQEGPAEPGDIGWIMGRIHTSGRIPAAGLTTNIEWIVVGDGIADLSENELELWYSAQDRFAVEVRVPGAGQIVGPVEPGEFIENLELDDGTFISIYNELYAPANGENYIACYLTPFFSEAGIVGVPAGTWTVRLLAREVRDGSYHGWIERDDPRRLGRVGSLEAWTFPSFFSQLSNVDSSSVSSLACGRSIVAVANLDEAGERINISSSQGPTRDNRQKPEIAAPGTDIIAANGFDQTGGSPWVSMTGTSMASPFVAGVVGLMLAVDPMLTASQIGGILRRTAAPLPGHDFRWRDDAGFGRVDAEACLLEAARVSQRRRLNP